MGVPPPLFSKYPQSIDSMLWYYTPLRPLASSPSGGLVCSEVSPIGVVSEKLPSLSLYLEMGEVLSARVRGKHFILQFIPPFEGG